MKKMSPLCRSQYKMVFLPSPALIYFLSQLFFVTLFCRKKFHNVQFESKWGGKGIGTKKQRLFNRIILHNFIQICQTVLILKHTPSPQLVEIFFGYYLDLRILNEWYIYFWVDFIYVIFRYLWVKLTSCLNFQFQRLNGRFENIWFRHCVNHNHGP